MAGSCLVPPAGIQTPVWHIRVDFRILARLSLVVLTLFLAADPLLLNPSHYGLLSVCAGLIALIGYIRNRTVDYSILLAGAIVCFVAMVSAVFSGYFWNGFEYSLVIGSFALLGAILAPASSGKWWFWCLIFLGGSVLVAIGFEYAKQVELFGVYGLARLPVTQFRNPNVLARFLGLVAFGIYLTAPTDRLKCLGFPFVLLLVLSGSRGALLAVLAAIVLLLFGRYEFSVRSRTSVIVLLIGLVLVMGVLAVYPSEVAKVTSLQRLKLAAESFSLLVERPLTGVGGWNFGLVYPGFSIDGRWQRHPHSLPLWLLTAFGVGGTLLIGYGFYQTGGWTVDGTYLPLFAFLVVHELVDTMIWIPGLFLLALLLLVRGLKGQSVSARTSLLIPFLAVSVTLVGIGVWKTDADFKRGLVELRNGNYPEARSYWWNDLAGFTSAHRGVAYARQKRWERASGALKQAIAVNDYDPYYRRLESTVLRKTEREKLADRYKDRYREMDPHGMLTLKVHSETESVDEPVGPSGSITFFNLWLNQRKPFYYIPLVREAMDSGKRTLALKRIQFLLGLPKLTQGVRTQLLEYESRLAGEDDNTEQDTRNEPGSGAAEQALFRGQFHNFLYRRPGFDYVSLQAID